MLKPCSSSDKRNRIRSLLCSPGEIRLRFSSATCCHLNCVPNLIRNVESDDLSSIRSSKSKDMYCQQIGVPVNHISNSAFDCFVEEVRKPIPQMIRKETNNCCIIWCKSLRKTDKPLASITLSIHINCILYHVVQYLFASLRTLL